MTTLSSNQRIALPGLSNEELSEVVSETLDALPAIGTALVIHPDYSRHDFSDSLTPILYRQLAQRGLKRLDTLNAGGTHRKMTRAELEKKLGLSKSTHPLLGEMLNHEFDDPAQLEHVTDLPPEFVSEKTSGNLREALKVDVNRLVFEPYDAIFAISGTIPHEALGYSGGTKIFFPGISGPRVIAMLHWAAVLMGIPLIIGTVDNPARDVVNAGTREIFKKIGSKPIVSLNMVYTEDSSHRVVPNGLFAGVDFKGFVAAHREASALSSTLHINYLSEAKHTVVQRLPEMYDEVWTAGKGSYKLQRSGVLADGAEIILYAPHIRCFHSNKTMDAAIRQIGYHGLAYVLDFCARNPDFDKNIASHVINVRGFGSMKEGKEDFPFSVTLAMSIPPEECYAVGLGYRDPSSLKQEDFNGPGKLWIADGGQWLYACREPLLPPVLTEIT